MYKNIAFDKEILKQGSFFSKFDTFLKKFLVQKNIFIILYFCQKRSQKLFQKSVEF